MNMLDLINRKPYILLLSVVLFSIGCKRDVEETQVYDNIIYQIDTAIIYSSSAEKTKQKSQTQYISIMYSDLFSVNISGNDLAELSELSLAVGDKTMANELTLSHYLNASGLDKPSDSEMRADIETFIEYTYIRFYQRLPTPYEKLFLKDLIEKDVQLSVTDVYTSFILSNEYYYY
jgi:hypothetical protein